jgi:hypothetical protein
MYRRHHPKKVVSLFFSTDLQTLHLAEQNHSLRSATIVNKALRESNFWSATHLCLRYDPAKCGRKIDMLGFCFTVLIALSVNQIFPSHCNFIPNILSLHDHSECILVGEKCLVGKNSCISIWQLLLLNQLIMQTS